MAKRTAGVTARWQMKSPAHKETHRSYSAALAAGQRYVGYTLEIEGRSVLSENIDLVAQAAAWKIDARGTQYDITVARIS